MLNNIRLATLLEITGERGKPRATYKIEEMSTEENMLMEALNLKGIHRDRPKIKGVGVYT